MKVGRSVIARISATMISTLSVPIPVETTETRGPAIRAGDRGELAMPALELDGVEASRDARSPVGVAGEEDVLGQFARSEPDVVLPFADRQGNAGIRVRQDLSLTHLRASQARNSGEDSPALSRASSTATHDPRSAIAEQPAGHDGSRGPSGAGGRLGGPVRPP